MKWLEIIALRAVQVDQNLLNQQIARLAEEIGIEKAMKIYINVRVETDWSIHMQHESERIEALGSDFGMGLSEILKEFGLVNHSVWVEQQLNEK